ncbi:hypothetical protein O181_122002 [Austropuccinia psidii MF-1]|uniref:Uncharacterized protein n=1 Tax=Austropuccinia psidii MF-1 TaxID=1389203 RepID=A0A9Q3KM80_9BASI|nr:hypothetical protein [Austropuccinia psidii MF-1]
MHIPDQIDWWGPPMGVSEFAGERLVGILQSLKTNNLFGSMECTLIKKFCQQQRLESKAEDQPKNSKTKYPPILQLEIEIYALLLVHLRETYPALRHYQDLPHPPNALVLRDYAHEFKSIDWKVGLKISSSYPNSYISFNDEDMIKYGQVSHIIEPKHDQLHTGPIFIVKVLKPSEERGIGFEQVTLFLQELDVVQAEETGLFAFICIDNIISLAAYRPLPAWSLGIRKPTFLLRVINKLVRLEIQNLKNNVLLEDVLNT